MQRKKKTPQHIVRERALFGRETNHATLTKRELRIFIFWCKWPSSQILSHFSMQFVKRECD